jgi:uncharacterized membrane protein YhaH (DUF805 family)
VANNNDPYASPASDLSSAGGQNEYNDGGVFSFSGRIGRLRYIAYPMALYMLAAFIVGVLSGITGSAIEFSEESGLLMLIPMIIMYGIVLVYGFVYAVRRLNDIGWSGFLSILYIIPVVNLILGILLIFMPGNVGVNKYGNPPAPNTLGIKILAFLLPTIAIIGILAAIAIPAYQGYVEEAAQYQQQ